MYKNQVTKIFFIITKMSIIKMLVTSKNTTIHVMSNIFTVTKTILMQVFFVFRNSVQTD